MRARPRVPLLDSEATHQGKLHALDHAATQDDGPSAMNAQGTPEGRLSRTMDPTNCSRSSHVEINAVPHPSLRSRLAHQL